MCDKSYVSLEKSICPICGKEFETGNLLLDKHLQNRFDKYTLTGFSMCPEHQKMLDDGYLFFIEVKNGETMESHLKIEDADRTGRLACIKKEAAQKIFNKDVKEINFISENAFHILEEMQNAGRERASCALPSVEKNSPIFRSSALSDAERKDLLDLLENAGEDGM